MRWLIMGTCAVLLAACGTDVPDTGATSPTATAESDAASSDTTPDGQTTQNTAPSSIDDPGTTPDYTLDVTLAYDQQRLDVRQTVTARNTSREEWNALVFNVPPNIFSGVFELDGVWVTQGDSRREVAVELETGETMLRVPLAEPLGPGEIASVEMRFGLALPPLWPTDWQPNGTLAYDQKLVQIGDWYPTLVPYVEGEGWTTWNFAMVGDPTIYPAADYDMTLHAGPDIVVASGGEVARPGEEGGAWQFHLENARAVSFLASPTFLCDSRDVAGVRVRSCYQPEHAPAGRAVLDMAERAVSLFSELFGPYPYDDLVIAENGYYGAMEFSATLSVTEPAYAFYGGFPDSLLETLIPHEVAHQWWYGVVGNDQVNEPWLDESLATYSELLYYERYYPSLTDWWWRYRVLRYEPSGPVDVSIYDYLDTESYVHSMYGQGAFFVRDLRAVMGDEAFFAFLRDYRERGEGKIVTADDFFAVARHHTDEDLTGLLEGYFRDPGH